MYTFDRLAVEYPALMKRQHVENCLMRQFFEKDGHNVQVQHPSEYLITDEKPVRPYASSEIVTNTNIVIDGLLCYIRLYTPHAWVD